jgi:6-phospho-beta-glucosidase
MSAVGLAVLGGGGVRIPALVDALFNRDAARSSSRTWPDVDRITLFEPDAARRQVLGTLCVELARRAGRPEAVRLTADLEEAIEGVDFVFSAIRVGGDQGRVLDEEIAVHYGILGQETVGAGGCAMALRTIPVVLSYCETIARLAPQAVLLNFTNPVGIIAQAIADQGAVRALGICDTPTSAHAAMARMFGEEAESATSDYCGLNHLGWFTGFHIGGSNRLRDLIDRFADLVALDKTFGVIPEAIVRHLGVIPTEYLVYYYDTAGCIERARTKGIRAARVAQLNLALLEGVGRALHNGDFQTAWGLYIEAMKERSASYMELESSTRGTNQSGEKTPPYYGGYAALAMEVIGSLTTGDGSRYALDVTNEGAVGFLEPDDVVEISVRVSPDRIERETDPAALPRSAKALIMQVKEYERALVRAVKEGSLELAEVALSMNPLVPGISAARRLLDQYRRVHEPHLSYLR